MTFRTIPVGDREVSLWELALDNNLATAISLGSDNSTIPPAALYAYHHTLRWCLHLSERGPVAYNAHWAGKDGWYTVDPTLSDDSNTATFFWDGFSPAGIRDDSLSDFITGRYPSGRPLVPVDDALVNRLDTWRARALQHAPSTELADEQVQLTFAQLFILRAVEDRRLAPSLPSLDTCITAAGLDRSRLQSLFSGAQDIIQSDLFASNFLGDLPPQLVSDIIRDLYTPAHLPWDQARYNFSWIETDILGRAYEKYLSTILHPTALKDSQLRIFEQPRRDVERIPVRRKAGVYYTPTDLVRYLTQRAFTCLDLDSDDHYPRAIDFSCGSGSFLVECAGHILDILTNQGDPTPLSTLVEQQLVIGIDVDRRAVILARLALWLRLAERPDPLPLPELEDIIFHGDALDPDTWRPLPDVYHVVVGNPPFLPTGTMPDRSTLVDRFDAAQGRFDYAYLFLEMGTRQLADTGVLAMVIPNRLFINRSARGIRDVLARTLDFQFIADYGALEVFSGVETYVATLVGRKTNESPFSSTVRFTQVKDLPERFWSLKLLRAEQQPSGFEDRHFYSYDAAAPIDNTRWLFLSPEDKRRRLSLQDQSVPLNTLAIIRQGIRTGANDLFLFELVSGREGNREARYRNGLNDVTTLETDLLRPAAYGSDIDRYGEAHGDYWLLYPYAQGQLIAEQELKSDYPLTYNYLDSYRGLLSERSSIRSTNYAWYELVRERNEDWLRAPKLLTRDLSSQASFGLDESGTLFLVGGTAVIPSESEYLLPLLGYLNSAIADWYLAQVAPTFQSNFKKYEPDHLKELPVPSLVFEPGDAFDSLNDLVAKALVARRTDKPSSIEDHEAAVDDLLSDALGF